MKTNFKKDLKTIIKQILLEIGLRDMIKLSAFDQGVQQRMLDAIASLEKESPEKYKELKALINKDAIEILLGGVDAANKKTGALPPAARSDEERRRWNK